MSRRRGAMLPCTDCQVETLLITSHISRDTMNVAKQCKRDKRRETGHKGSFLAFLFVAALIIAFMAALLSISQSSTGTSGGKIRGTGLQTVKVFTDQYISKVANSTCHPHSSRVIS
ncbi:hypothetical protein INR49_006741 [Caranx melampygus]|nr:hypothetical protein INR49_006741 [Caranx melampygus]